MILKLQAADIGSVAAAFNITRHNRGNILCELTIAHAALVNLVQNVDRLVLTVVAATDKASGVCCKAEVHAGKEVLHILHFLGGWSFFTLTEDIEFDTWCATHGVRIGFNRRAMLYDEQVSGFAQSWKQRIRWTQGGIQVSLLYAKDYLRGMLRGGRTGWASFECATLSLFGYGLSILSVVSVALSAAAEHGTSGLLIALLGGVAGLYISMALLGALTVLTEWKRISAATGKKLLSVLTFPLFMMTFIPAAVCSVFCKRGWEPTRHTVAVGIGSFASASKE